MGIVSYAQNFEDVILWRVLSEVKDGFYIDVGAQDPLVDSVSRAFYENGWRGVHVEAIAEYATKIRINRPDEIVVEAAVSDAPGFINFYQIADTGLSTGDVEIASQHKKNGFDVIEVKVRTTTLDEIFLQLNANEIHWLKIDVEGMEKKVLAGWGGNSARPWILVIESTYPNTQIENHKQWENIVLDMNYQFVYFDGLSRFYLHKNKSTLSSKFGPPPNIFDNFLISKNSHFSALSCNEIKEQQKEITSLQEIIKNHHITTVSHLE